MLFSHYSIRVNISRIITNIVLLMFFVENSVWFLFSGLQLLQERIADVFFNIIKHLNIERIKTDIINDQIIGKNIKFSYTYFSCIFFLDV